MKIFIATISFALLAACQSTPKLEEDTRYVKLAHIVDVHEFTELERKQAETSRPSESRVGVSVGIGMGSGGGSFGGVMMGIGSVLGDHHDSDDKQPQIAHGAIRYTVQLLENKERIEVMSYTRYKMGDCVKVLAGHPSEYPRFFDLKAGERCE